MSLINPEKIKVLAGIVLYNPDVERLRENIQAIKPQVDAVLLIENGSKSLDYREQLKDFSDVLYIKNSGSMGIAYALNQILGYAYSHGYEWVITLDQDSVVTPGMIEVYKQEANENMGILGCWIDDRNYKRDESWGISKGTFETNWVITSAAFTNVKAWKDCGGFDTSMFIDWVDWDICESMRLAGYKIMKTYKTKLLHENGEGTYLVMVRKHEIQILNRPSFRYYYNFRNQVYMARKYSHLSLAHETYELLFKLYAVLRYEKHRCSNFCAMIKGYFAGFYPKVQYQFITEDFLHLEAGKI